MNEDIENEKNPSIGIAFGGGAARGFAHIGVLEALAEAGDERLMPQLVAGTSVGSILATIYAAGLSVENIKAAAKEVAWSGEVVDVLKSITDILHNLTGALLPGSLENWLKNIMHVEFVPRRGGLLSSKGLELWIDRLIDPQKSFEDLEKKLAIVATDIERGERVIFTSRPMAKHIMQNIKAHSHRFIRSRVVDSCPSIATAIRASCAVPGVFETVQAEGLRLVDGGIVDQVPVEIVRAMGADIVIGVSLGFTRYFKNPTRPHQSLSNAWELIGREGIARSMSLADIAVEIPGIETTSLIDLEQRDTFIAQGKAAMRPQIENLKRCVRNFEHKNGQA